MSALERLLTDNLPPESGPWLLAAADWWPLVSQAVLLLAVAVLLGCLGFVVGFLGGGEGSGSNSTERPFGRPGGAR